jgi:cation diffusion facilitator family transporter
VTVIPESPSGPLPPEAVRVTLLGAVLNVILTLLKLYVGILGSSRALVADAVHSMSDLVSDVVVIWGLVAGSRPSDENHHYGHAKLELLAEMILGAILLTAGAGIVLDAFKDFLSGSHGPPSAVVLPVAALSVILKEALYHATMAVSRKTGRSSLIANAWHHRSDALTSAAVLVGAGLAVLRPELSVADPLMGILIAVVVIRVGIKIGIDAGLRLIDTAPSVDFINRMEKMILADPMARSVRNLKMRYVGRLIAVEVHLGLDPDMSVQESHEVARRVKRAIMERDRRVFDVLIHVEPEMDLVSSQRHL